MKARSRCAGRQRHLSRAVLTLAILLAASVEPGAQATDGVARFLRDHFGVSDSELRRLGAGAAVTRSLDTVDAREVATFGAVRVRVTPAFYMAQLRDIAAFKQHEAVLQIGVFGSPADRSDLRTLTLPDGMSEALRRCRPRDCDVQLSAAAMAQLKAATAQSEATLTAQFASVLADVTNRYVTSGGAGLMTYDDDDRPVSVDAEFARLIAEPPAILRQFTELLQHVQRYPAQTAGVHDLVYWSRERLGPADIVSVTHLALAPQLASPPLAAAAISRQIYASRYFDASLGLTFVLHERSTTGDAVYVAYVNRSRIDALDGWFGSVKRAVVRSRTRSGMKDALSRMQRRMEQRFTTAP